MDKAVLGYCRIGYFRLGVCRGDWDSLLDRFQVAAPYKMVVDGVQVKVDGRELRVNMFTDRWNQMLKAFRSGG